MTFMLLRHPVCILAVACVGCSRNRPPQQAAAPTDLGSRFDALVPGLLERRSVPGVQIAVIDQAAVMWHGSYGFADLSQSRPVSDRTLFNIGSVSKTVTAWGVLALVEARADLELDSSVERCLTRWRIPESEFDVDAVSVRRLLSHTSGFSLLPASESFTYPSSLEGILSQSYGSFGHFHLVDMPGARFEYNNGNYVLLELLVEEVAGEGFAHYMQHTVFDPLGMDATTYAPSLDQLATPYDERKRPLSQAHADVGNASGGLYTTASDLGRLVAAAMAGADGSPPGRGILKPETVAEMIAPAAKTGGRYGLGYKILAVSDALTLVGHDGSNPGWNATFMAAPQKGVGIVVLTNGRNGASIMGDIICTWADWETDIELTGLCDGTRPIPRR